MIYNELKQRGTADFPIEYHYIDKNHTRYEMSAHWHSEMEIIRILRQQGIDYNYMIDTFDFDVDIVEEYENKHYECGIGDIK